MAVETRPFFSILLVSQWTFFTTVCVISINAEDICDLLQQIYSLWLNYSDRSTWLKRWLTNPEVRSPAKAEAAGLVPPPLYT